MTEALRFIWSDKEREQVVRDRLTSRTRGLGWWAAYDLAQRMGTELAKLANKCLSEMRELS